MNGLERVTTKILNSILGMLIFIIAFTAFYLPYEIRIIPIVDQYLEPVRIVCAAILIIFFLLLYISRLRVFRDNWFLFACIAFIGVVVFTTMMFNGYGEAIYGKYGIGTYGTAGIFLIMTIAVFFKVNPKKYILMAFFLLLIANLANTYTVYHYWGVGMWEVYGQYRNVFYSLVGNYNGGIEYVLPMAICGSAYAHKYGKWLDFINYPVMIISLMMAFKCDSMTQIMAYAAVLAFMFIGNIAMISKGFAKAVRFIFQPVILWGINFAAFVAVIILNKTDWVARIGIDPTFHNRRHIWNMSMDWIKQSPIWGWGQETVAYEATKITGYAHSHSSYLEIAYKSGFVGSVFMFLMLVAAIVAIYRNRNHRLSYIMSALMFIMGIAMIVETYPIVTIILTFGLVYYISKNAVESSETVRHIKKVKASSVSAPGASSGASGELSDTVKIDDTMYFRAVGRQAEVNGAYAGNIQSTFTEGSRGRASGGYSEDGRGSMQNAYARNFQGREAGGSAEDTVVMKSAAGGEVSDTVKIDDTMYFRAVGNQATDDGAFAGSMRPSYAAGSQGRNAGGYCEDGRGSMQNAYAGNFQGREAGGSAEDTVVMNADSIMRGAVGGSAEDTVVMESAAGGSAEDTVVMKAAAGGSIADTIVVRPAPGESAEDTIVITSGNDKNSDHGSSAAIKRDKAVYGDNSEVYTANSTAYNEDSASYGDISVGSRSIKEIELDEAMEKISHSIQAETERIISEDAGKPME